MINLDPALLDQDKIRKEKRKALLKRYSLPILLLMIISFFFLSAWLYNLVYFIVYSNKNYPIAEGFTETRFVMNVLEPYIADYNQGTARLMMGEYTRAESSFTESLQKSPPQAKLCKIYVNLSLSIELQGDTALQGSDYNKALEAYNRAESVLYSNGCAGKGSNSNGKDSKAEAAKERINDKRSDATDKMNNHKDADEDYDDTPEKKQISGDDLEKINKGIMNPGEIHDRTSVNPYTLCWSSNGDKCW